MKLIFNLIFFICLLSDVQTFGQQNKINDSRLAEYRIAYPELDTLMKKGILTEDVSGLKYFTGYSYKTLYDWDQYFESIVQIYMGWPSDYIKNGVIIFLKNQKESGFIARSVPSNEWHDNEHVKPFLAQISCLVYDAYGEKDWILQEPYFTKLKKYLDYWLVDMEHSTVLMKLVTGGLPPRAAKLTMHGFGDYFTTGIMLQGTKTGAQGDYQFDV